MDQLVNGDSESICCIWKDVLFQILLKRSSLPYFLYVSAYYPNGHHADQHRWILHFPSISLLPSLDTSCSSRWFGTYFERGQSRGSIPNLPSAASKVILYCNLFWVWTWAQFNVEHPFRELPFYVSIVLTKKNQKHCECFIYIVL